MIDSIARSTGHSRRLICDTLQVPRSSYYHAAAPTRSQLDDAQMGQFIRATFHQHRRRYGYRRIWKQLVAEGLTCAPDRVRRLMRQQGLLALQPKTYVPQTSDGRADLPSPNLLLGAPMPERPNQVWAGDITFIPCGEKWLYLAVVIDLCSRRIVGWALADHMRSDLVIAAMRQAIASRSHTTGIMLLRLRLTPSGQPAAGCLSALGSTATVGASMAAKPSASCCAWPACARACPPVPILITTPGPSLSWAR